MCPQTTADRSRKLPQVLKTDITMFMPFILKHRKKKTCQMCGADTKHSSVFCSSDCRISQQQEDDMEFY